MSLLLTENTSSYSAVALQSVLFLWIGAGFGSYQAVDFALVMDVLPAEKDKAKDLAVCHQV